MKIQLWSLGIAALTLSASTATYANVHVNVDVNPFGWGAPPVVYEPPRYYARPPVVYYGRGNWGDHRDGRGRGRDHDRGRSEHHDDGDRRR
jgi:hypothetical protein